MRAVEVIAFSLIVTGLFVLMLAGACVLARATHHYH